MVVLCRSQVLSCVVCFVLLWYSLCVVRCAVCVVCCVLLVCEGALCVVGCLVVVVCCLLFVVCLVLFVFLGVVCCGFRFVLVS